MFTGIIEATGTIEAITENGTNRSFLIRSSLSNQLKIDQSLSHSGVCLTVEEVQEDHHRVTAIAETISKTTVGDWKTGDQLNLERCMMLNGRLDGHIVQGHVDTTGLCTERKEMDGSWEFTFSFPESFAALVIEKGSISLNGTSLTIFNITRSSFTIAVIPYTFEHTNISGVTAGTRVNLEFDMMGKYVQRQLELQQIS
jgi:riboflavin synthase